MGGTSGSAFDSRHQAALSESEQVSLEEFLESCRATQLLAELEDEDEMPDEGDEDDVDDDEDEDDTDISTQNM